MEGVEFCVARNIHPRDIQKGLNLKCSAITSSFSATNHYSVASISSPIISPTATTTTFRIGMMPLGFG